MRIGVRAHDFGRLPADELAARIAAKGLSCVQLVPNKAIAGLDLKPGDLSARLARELGGAFKRHGLQVSVLGCYINPIHPDPGTRATLLGWFKEHLRFARDFGCDLVALESGSVNADYSPSPENATEPAFQSMLGSLSELVAEAEKFGVAVGLEAVATHTVSTPKKMRRALDSLGSKHLRVVFDPVNLISFDNHLEEQRLVEESVELFGDRIAVVHAKDYRVEGNGIRTVRVGCGQFRYGPLMQHLSGQTPQPTIVIEETTEATARECAEYLSKAAEDPSCPQFGRRTLPPR